MNQIQSIEELIEDHSTSLNIPLYIFNTDLIANLLIIIKPLTLSQVDSFKFTPRVDASRNPLPLPKNLSGLKIE